jgi:hypothetical protein
MNIEVSDIWKYLDLNEVKYLTIGGFAVNFYGYARTTGDIDLLIEDSQENRKKLRKTFKDLGLGDFEEIERAEFVPGWTDFSIGYGLKLDIMTAIKGFDKKAFAELYQMSKVAHIGDTPVRFIDYGHLIASKKATNRPKDQLDIEEMEKVRKLSEDDNVS